MNCTLLPSTVSEMTKHHDRLVNRSFVRSVSEYLLFCGCCSCWLIVKSEQFARCSFVSFVGGLVVGMESADLSVVT